MQDFKKFVMINNLSFSWDNANEGKLSSWNILREDFMMGGKMKDWDRDNDDMEYDNENDK